MQEEQVSAQRAERKAKNYAENTEGGEWLLDMAHEVGGGFGGFFDFVDTMRGGMGAVQAIGEDISVGTDHAKKIVEGVGDSVQAMGGQGFIATGVLGSEIQGRTLSDSAAPCNQLNLFAF